MRNILLFITIFSALTLTLTTGCSGKIATLKVTGVVTFDGQPLANANVQFTPKTEGQGNPGYAITDENGLYKLQTLLGAAEAGTTPGDYDVYITCVERGEVWKPSPGDTGASATGGMRQSRSVIPERYGNTMTSGLSAKVEKGNLVHDFALTSD
jgi:hypothetical protein